MLELKLHFPKQSKDYKQASRIVRRNPLFRDMITYKSDDRRDLTITFENETQLNTLSPILVKSLEELGYVVEIVE